MDKPNIDKVKLESSNIADENFEKLASLFPNVVTETTIDGQLVRAIDKDKLMQEINAYVLEGLEERYNFTWPDKRKSVVLANAPTRNTLRACKEESKDFDKTENLYIEGDNLEVLKLLRNTYLGQVKMIYIDPPYNTGKDFVYKDNFFMSKEDYLENSGQIDENDNKYFSNTETNGRFHTDWLNMMYPRLKMARDFLSNDGVIFISIDDNELDNLTKICNEIFGENNFIANIIRNTNSSKNQSLFVSVSHEYCLVYAKNITILKNKHEENKWQVPKNNIKEYVEKVKQLQNKGLKDNEISDELKELTKYPRFIDFTNYWYFDTKGLYSKGDLGGVNNGNMEPIINPITKKPDPVPPGGFRFNTEKLNELIKENRIHFHTDGSLPRLKRYLSENYNQRPKSIMSDDQRPDNSLLQELNTPFDNPKQLAFIKRIISVIDKDAIVLDFFSGSATTAHAVMQLNAEDGGNRKYIMVQLPAETPEDSEARKAGYNTICEIGKERIRRAGEKIKKDYPNANIDTGFRVFKLDSSNMEDVYYEAEKISQQDIRKTISNIKVDRSNEDLLFQIILLYGIPLTCKIEIKKVNNRDVYFVDDTFLLVCFEKDIDEKTIEELAKKEPKFMVFNQNMQDSTLANIEQIFKLISPTTIMNLI